ncbi:MAG: hypothetical protein P4M09_26610 [Devosia sp.]|nr:hypothetical protein [Devosia sp.]
MRKEQEALLIAALAGLVIVSAAAFFVQPGLGGKSQPAQGQYAAAVSAGQFIPTPQA